MSQLNDFNARELTSKHAQLMDEIEKLPPGTKVSEEKTIKIKDLEAELRQRLYSLMKGGVLPILVTVAKTIVKESDIIFHFDVFSTLNTRIDHFRIPAPTKDEAWEEARKKAKKYPGDIHLKIG